MQARRANSDRVTSARAAALSMLAMSSSENQNETTRPMGRHIRTAPARISTATFTVAA